MDCSEFHGKLLIDALNLALALNLAPDLSGEPCRSAFKVAQMIATDLEASFGTAIMPAIAAACADPDSARDTIRDWGFYPED
jgi:hypothetical protein